MRDEALMLNRIKDAHKASHKAYDSPRAVNTNRSCSST